MAYFNQQDKAKRAPSIRAILKKYGMKGSMSVDNNSTFVVTLKSGALDLIGYANRSNELMARQRGEIFREVDGHFTVNENRAVERATELGEEVIAEFFSEIIEVMRGDDWYNNSDAMTDYFDISHYIWLDVGRWNKPYEFTPLKTKAS